MPSRCAYQRVDFDLMCWRVIVGGRITLSCQLSRKFGDSYDIIFRTPLPPAHSNQFFIVLKLIIHKITKFFPIHLSLRQLHHECLKRVVKLSCNSSHKVCLVYHVKARGNPNLHGAEKKSRFQFKMQSITRTSSDDENVKQGFAYAWACKCFSSRSKMSNWARKG